MPKCGQCGARFPTWLVIDGRLRNLGSRKYCLTCSPRGRHNTRRLECGKRPILATHATYQCPRCKCAKAATDFYLRADGIRRQSWCRNCNNEHRVARFREDRLAALRHYSDGEIRCVCCGERTLEFLALDHVNNDGGVHRRAVGKNGGGSFYGWLRRTGYTYDGLVVACHNCNLARAMYGACPHKRSTSDPVAQLDSAFAS